MCYSYKSVEGANRDRLQKNIHNTAQHLTIWLKNLERGHSTTEKRTKKRAATSWVGAKSSDASFLPLLIVPFPLCKTWLLERARSRSRLTRSWPSTPVAEFGRVGRHLPEVFHLLSHGWRLRARYGAWCSRAGSGWWAAA